MVSAAVQLRMLFFESDLKSGGLSPNERQVFEDKRNSLVWETIPELLVPSFAPLDSRLLELENRVGEFRLVRQYANRQIVLLAVNTRHEQVVVKGFPRSRVLCLRSGIVEAC